VTENIRIYTDKELNIRNDGLKKIKIGMEELEIEFFLIMGVLLGAVREKDFIKWDWDVELGIFSNSLIYRLDEIKEYFDNDYFNVEVVDRSYDGLKVNIFYNNNKFTLWGLHFAGKWLQRKSFKFPKKYFKVLDELNFRGEIYKIPNNVEDFLTFVYGDWETPRKTLVKKKYFNKRVYNKKSVFRRIFNKIK
jgi:phosphorylcholine metabolism protein LicD